MKKIDPNKYDIVTDRLLAPDHKPVSTNNSDSFSSFYNKKIYERNSFLDIFGVPAKNKPLNLLYDKTLYGRVDLDNNPIIVDNTKIKTKFINDKQLSLMNFVFDAFNDFLDYWNYLKKIDKLVKNSFFYEIDFTSGFTDAMRLYHEHMKKIFDSIYKQISNKNISLTSFEQFMEQFADYIDGTTPRIPITFSSFVISTTASPVISGLCINVNSEDHTLDQTRYDLIKEDPNFEIFKKTAMKFGFFIDKHMPWRMFADIDSPMMKPYLDKYNLTQDNLYQTNYMPAIDLDLEVLRTYTVSFYNDLISNKKVVVKPVYNICKKTNSITVKKDFKFVPNLNMNKVVVDREFDNKFLKLYLFIKIRENNYNWTIDKFNNVALEFIQMKEQLDTRRALRYIYPLIKHSSAEPIPQRNFKFR